MRKILTFNSKDRHNNKVHNFSHLGTEARESKFAALPPSLSSREREDSKYGWHVVAGERKGEEDPLFLRIVDKEGKSWVVLLIW